MPDKPTQVTTQEEAVERLIALQPEQRATHPTQRRTAT